MKVFVVAPPGSNFPQPGALTGNIFTKLMLDHPMDKNPAHAFVTRSMPKQRNDILIPMFSRDFFRLSIDEGIKIFILGALRFLWFCEPNVNIQSKLVASMAVVHQAATRLRHISNKHRSQLVCDDFLAQNRDKVDEFAVSVIAVSESANGTKALATFWQGSSTAKTTVRISPNRLTTFS